MRLKAEIAGAQLPEELLEREFSQARNIGKVQLGESCLFFKKFSGATYLPYGRILRAWLRQEEVKARMCCATANFDQFYVVMDCDDGQQRRGQVIDKSTGQSCLDHIAARNPAAKIAYAKPEERNV